jgi:CCR4-NOT transcriptional regulation complex NOT5 subunit
LLWLQLLVHTRTTITQVLLQPQELVYQRTVARQYYSRCELTLSLVHYCAVTVYTTHAIHCYSLSSSLDRSWTGADNSSSSSTVTKERHNSGGGRERDKPALSIDAVATTNNISSSKQYSSNGSLHLLSVNSNNSSNSTTAPPSPRSLPLTTVRGSPLGERNSGLLSPRYHYYSTIITAYDTATHYYYFTGSTTILQLCY